MRNAENKMETEVKNILARVVFLAIIAIITVLEGCGDFEVEDRVNPYDAKNRLAMKASIELLTDAGNYDYPSWSSDETKVAYYSRSYLGIHVVDIASKSIVELEKCHRWESSPRWSPTANKIAYMHDPDYNISVRDYPGNSCVPKSEPLTKDEVCLEGSLAWSPDGEKIAYVQTIDNTRKIKIMDKDGKNNHELNISNTITDPYTITDWLQVESKDGGKDEGKLLFICEGKKQAFIIDIGTGSLQSLPIGVENGELKTSSLCYSAAWSADGSKIIYITKNYERYELWMMNADGTQKVVIMAVKEGEQQDNRRYAVYMQSLNCSKNRSKDGFSILFSGSDSFSANDFRKFICLMKVQTG